MGRPWHRGAIVLGVLGIAALAFAGPAVLHPQTVESRTDIAKATEKSIITHVSEIESLLSDAQSQGKAVKAGCIKEKLVRAQKDEAAAETVMKGWSLGADDTDYAQRQLDRILLLQVYSMVYAQEARACKDAKPASDVNQIEITNGTAQPQAPVQDPIKPPFFERPPLASPF
jgi:hypothetical protein